MKIIQFCGQYLHVHEDTVDGMFRILDDQEQQTFRKWAREQPAGTEPNPIWHPVAQDELFLLQVS